MVVIINITHRKVLVLERLYGLLSLDYNHHRLRIIVITWVSIHVQIDAYTGDD